MRCGLFSLDALRISHFQAVSLCFPRRIGPTSSAAFCRCRQDGHLKVFIKCGSMTKSEAFLAQAKSDFQVFELLLQQNRERVPACHPGHYLQMSMEKLAKAALQRAGDDPSYTHEAFSSLRQHLKRRDIARTLGYPNFSTFRDFLDRNAGLFHRIEALHPDVPKNTGGPKVTTWGEVEPRPVKQIKAASRGAV